MSYRLASFSDNHLAGTETQNGPRLSRTRAVPSYPLVISVPRCRSRM